jgi:hypothetical protein
LEERWKERKSEEENVSSSSLALRISRILQFERGRKHFITLSGDLVLEELIDYSKGKIHNE